MESKDLENDLQQADASSEETVTEETSSEETANTEDAEVGKEEEKPSTESKLKRFGKKKDKAVEKLEEKLADLEDKRVRQLAEFENFRKRSEKEKSQMFEMGAKTVVEKILPVIDNFERGLAGIPERKKHLLYRVWSLFISNLLLHLVSLEYSR